LHEQSADKIDHPKSKIAATGNTTDETPPLTFFDHCSISSLNVAFQKAICSRLNLHLMSQADSSMSSLNRVAAKNLEDLLYTSRRSRMSVHISSIAGFDGNCLFRALSHAITRS